MDCLQTIFSDISKLETLFPNISLNFLLHLLNNNAIVCSLLRCNKGRIQSHTITIWISDQSNLKIKATWEGDLGFQFSEEWWEEAVQGICTVSSCARLVLIQFKVTYRVHLSQPKLSEIYPEVDDKCDRCMNPHCHLSHVFFLPTVT